MDDLIRRQDAIKAVESMPNCYNGFSDTYYKACIIGLLEEVPATCKYWDAESIATASDWFCPAGERREDG